MSTAKMLRLCGFPVPHQIPDEALLQPNWQYRLGDTKVDVEKGTIETDFEITYAVFTWCEFKGVRDEEKKTIIGELTDNVVECGIAPKADVLGELLTKYDQCVKWKEEGGVGYDMAIDFYSKIIKEFSDKSDIIARLLMELQVTQAKLKKFDSLNSKKSFLNSKDNFLKLDDNYYLVKDKAATEEALRSFNVRSEDEIIGFPQIYPSILTIEKEWIGETEYRYGYYKIKVKCFPIVILKQLLYG